LANFFSASYWKARFFKALPTAQADANPGSMTATLTGSGGVGAADLDAAGAPVEEPGGWFWPWLPTKADRARNKAEAERQRRRRLKQIEEDEARALSIFGKTEKAAPSGAESLPAVAKATDPASVPAEKADRPSTVTLRRILTLPQRRPEPPAPVISDTAIRAAEDAAANVLALEIAAKAKQDEDEDEALILLLLAS